MKKRIVYLDIAKGILILMVVIGHVFETGPINQYVYTFHMPAFFILSGIMFQFSTALNKTFRKVLWDKIYTLAIPFFFFECLGVLSNIASFGITLNIKGYIYQTLILDCNNGPDWFIWALLRAEICFLLIHKLIRNKYVIWGVSGVLGLLMIVFHNSYHLVGSTGIGFLFLTLGYYAASLFLKERNIWVAVLAGIISALVCIFNGKVDLGPWQFGSVPLYILGSLAGTVFVLEISKFISSRLLAYYGCNTLSVLGTHQAMNLLFKFRMGIQEYSTALGAGVFLVIAVLEIPIIYVFNRFIPFLVGKKSRKASAQR